MPTMLLTLLLFGSSPVHAAPLPDVAPHTEQGVHVDVPVSWKVLVKPDSHNVTISQGIATTITMYWYDYKPGVSLDLMLDILVKTVKQNIPVGELTEINREPVPHLADDWDVKRGRIMNGKVDAMGYTMNVGAVTIIDESTHRIMAAFLVAPPETYAEIGGATLLATVVESLWLDADAPRPAPGWWWNATPPASLAATTP